MLVTGAFLLIGVICVLTWFFLRTPKAIEMFYYVPDNAQLATGINIGHAQVSGKLTRPSGRARKEPSSEQIGDAIAKGDDTDFDSLIDYVVKGEHIEGTTIDCWSIVYHTKYPFDQASLANITGAQQKKLSNTDDRVYYLATIAGRRLRLFSPKPRLIVAYPDGVKEDVFRKIYDGNADNRQGTLGVRMGRLGKRVVKGTFWQMGVYDEKFKPPVVEKPKDGALVDDETGFRVTLSEALRGSKGYGVKASLASSEVQFEMVVWHPDSDPASAYAAKMKESELAIRAMKAPRRGWFTSKTQGLGDKKVGIQVLSSISFGSSGDLFYVKAACDAKDAKQNIGSMVHKVMGTENRPAGPGGQGSPRRRKYGQRKLPKLQRASR